MHFIDGKDQKSELRSSRNVLTNHMKSELVIYGLGAGHTRKHTYFGGMRVILRSQAMPACGWRAPGLKRSRNYLANHTKSKSRH